MKTGSYSITSICKDANPSSSQSTTLDAVIEVEVLNYLYENSFANIATLLRLPLQANYL